MGFVFQAYNLIPTLTADENIRPPLMLGGQDGDSAWINDVVHRRRVDGSTEAPAPASCRAASSSE